MAHYKCELQVNPSQSEEFSEHVSEDDKMCMHHKMVEGTNNLSLRYDVQTCQLKCFVLYSQSPFSAEVTEVRFYADRNYTERFASDETPELNLDDMVYVWTDGSSPTGVTAQWFCNDAYDSPLPEPTYEGA